MYYLKLCVIVALTAVGACSSAKNRKADEKSLVRVAIVKLVNVSKQPNYDYLSESLTDATQTSMGKKFVYYQFPAEKTVDLLAEVEKNPETAASSRLRSQALQIDADLLIYGFFTTVPGKKGEGLEITIKVFRTDKGINIASLKRNAVISSKIFTEIESIAAGVVAQIAEYRSDQIRENGEKDASPQSGEKIHFTRESINIAPFFPPAF